jgi:hypothetical protein
MFLPTIVIDGEVVGTWTRTTRTREVVIDLSPFHPLSGRATTGLAAAVQAYGAFLGKPARTG